MVRQNWVYHLLAGSVSTGETLHIHWSLPLDVMRRLMLYLSVCAHIVRRVLLQVTGFLSFFHPDRGHRLSNILRVADRSEIDAFVNEFLVTRAYSVVSPESRFGAIFGLSEVQVQFEHEFHADLKAAILGLLVYYGTEDTLELASGLIRPLCTHAVNIVEYDFDLLNISKKKAFCVFKIMSLIS